VTLIDTHITQASAASAANSSRRRVQPRVLLRDRGDLKVPDAGWLRAGRILTLPDASFWRAQPAHHRG
jgi:hypothetical protein